MERFTISLENQLAQQFDALIAAHNYSNRSEAIRDLIRERLEGERLKSGGDDGYCIATLSYVYNHHESELTKRITSTHHAHHDLTMSSTHIHLDHDNCLEIVILRGLCAEVRQFANSVIAVRGVRHGNLQMIPIEHSEVAHSSTGQSHIHSHPCT